MSKQKKDDKKKKHTHKKKDDDSDDDSDDEKEYRMRDVYKEVIDKRFLVKHDNPAWEKTHIRLPMPIMVILGSTGSGKTSTLLNIMMATKKAWATVTIIAKSLEEPIYEHLIAHNEGNDDFRAFEGIESLPDLDVYDRKLHNLIVIDDMQNEPKRKQLVLDDYAIRCRKKGCSLVYLAQTFDRLPSALKKQVSYLILKNVPKKRDLRLILSEYGNGDMSTDDLVQLMKFATAPSPGESRDSKTHFFMMDLCTSDPKYKYRRDFTPIYFAEDA